MLEKSRDEQWCYTNVRSFILSITKYKERGSQGLKELDEWFKRYYTPHAIGEYDKWKDEFRKHYAKITAKLKESDDVYEVSLIEEKLTEIIEHLSAVAKTEDIMNDSKLIDAILLFMAVAEYGFSCPIDIWEKHLHHRYTSIFNLYENIKTELARMFPDASTRYLARALLDIFQHNKRNTPDEKRSFQTSIVNLFR